MQKFYTQQYTSTTLTIEKYIITSKGFKQVVLYNTNSNYVVTADFNTDTPKVGFFRYTFL